MVGEGAYLQVAEVQIGMAAPKNLAWLALRHGEALAARIALLGDRWNQLVKKMCEQGALAALVRELATQAGLQAIDETSVPPRWHLVVEREPLHRPRHVLAQQDVDGGPVPAMAQAFDRDGGRVRGVATGADATGCRGWIHGAG